MNTITNILKRLPGLRTAEDFASALADLERGHTETAAALADLEARRESCLFDGGDLAALESDIAAAESRVKTFAVAVEGATKRQAAAVESERMAELEAVAMGARKQTDKLRKALAAFSETAAELARRAEGITALRRQIAGHNVTLREGGRGDLVCVDPIKTEARSTGQHTLDPLAGLHLPGRWSHGHAVSGVVG